MPAETEPCELHEIPARKPRCRVCHVARCRVDHPRWPCVKCKKTLPRQDFALVTRRGKPPRRAARCRSCLAEDRRGQESRKRDTDRILWERYHLTPERYQEILSAQNGVCAICFRPPGKTRLSVDHDHSCCPGIGSCGRCIRGLLHRTCNTGIALLHDDPEILARAAQYLRGDFVGTP